MRACVGGCSAPDAGLSAPTSPPLSTSSPCHDQAELHSGGSRIRHQPRCWFLSWAAGSQASRAWTLDERQPPWWPRHAPTRSPRQLADGGRPWHRFPPHRGPRTARTRLIRECAPWLQRGARIGPAGGRLPTDPRGVSFGIFPPADLPGVWGSCSPAAGGRRWRLLGSPLALAARQRPRPWVFPRPAAPPGAKRSSGREPAATRHPVAADGGGSLVASYHPQPLSSEQRQWHRCSRRAADTAAPPAVPAGAAFLPAGAITSTIPWP